MERSVRINILFEKYLRQACTPGELEELIALLKDPEIEQALDGQMKEVWNAQQKKAETFDVKWHQMYNAVITSEEHTDHLLKNAIQRNKILLRSVVALCLVAMLTVGIYFLGGKQTFSKANHENNVLSPAIKQTAKRQVIHLPDGSTVTLNNNARLDYPPVFNKNRRDVYLQGEAFFDIQHKNGQPFYVHARDVTIKVLGTAFNIKSNESAELVEITVSRGKVQVLKDTTLLGTLTASEQMSVTPKWKEVVIKTVDTQAVMNWKPEEIFFNNITVREALQFIAERYEMKVELLNPELADCRITATFSEDDTVQEILDVLCGVSRSVYTIDGNNIKINGKGCE